MVFSDAFCSVCGRATAAASANRALPVLGGVPPAAAPPPWGLFSFLALFRPALTCPASGASPATLCSAEPLPFLLLFLTPLVCCCDAAGVASGCACWAFAAAGAVADVWRGLLASAGPGALTADGLGAGCWRRLVPAGTTAGATTTVGTAVVATASLERRTG